MFAMGAPECRRDKCPAQRAHMAGREATIGFADCMDIQAAQREVRSVYIGGFAGQLVSSIIWLLSAALGTWGTPKASILTVIIGGFFIFALTQMLLRLWGRRASVSRENLFHSLGMKLRLCCRFQRCFLCP